jgi:hypothetical protein
LPLAGWNGEADGQPLTYNIFSILKMRSVGFPALA